MTDWSHDDDEGVDEMLDGAAGCLWFLLLALGIFLGSLAYIAEGL